MIESKAVYDCMEGIVATDSNPICACFAARGAPRTRSRAAARADTKFRNTGLERGAALTKDIAWMKEQARASARAAAQTPSRGADAARAATQGLTAPPQAAAAGAKYAA